VLPRPQWRKLLVLPMLALALATGITLLPAPPAPAEPPQLQARTAELDRIAEQLRDLFARGDLPVETQREIEQKVQELRQKVEAGQVPEWRDLDQLEQQLERAELLAAASREGKDGGSSGSERDGGAAQNPTPEALAKAAAALAAAGLLDDVVAPLAAGLQAAQGADGSFDPSALPQDAESLRALAEAMAAAAGQSLGELAQRLPPEQLADLRALVEGFGAGTQEGVGEGVGRGGVDRGPGHAALAMTEDAQGGAEQALALPPGHAPPREWVPIGDRRTEPVVQPERNPTPGQAGAGGMGGATWQLQLAPRHRAVVQRFFDSTAAGKGK
jgi:TolA-binding protein